MSEHTLELHARDAADIGSYSDVAAFHGKSHTPRVATTPSSHIHRSFEFWKKYDATDAPEPYMALVVVDVVMSVSEEAVVGGEPAAPT